MSRKLDADIEEWAASVVYDLRKSGFSGINVVERILKDPGISTNGCAHRVLWWPPRSRRKWKVIRAMHQIDSISQMCLVVDASCILNEDNTIFTRHDLAKNSSIEVRRFNEIKKKAKSKLSQILGA